MAINDRVQSAQSRGQRIADVRSTNQYSKNGLDDLHTAYSAADAPATEGAAAWGSAIRTEGFDHITLFVDHTAGTTTTGVEIVAQVSYTDGSTEAQWFDLWEDSGSGTALSLWQRSIATTTSDRVAFDIPTFGRFMRFKVWVPGTVNTNSRVTLQGHRDMDGH
jgi:hypothetical protein